MRKAACALGAILLATFPSGSQATPGNDEGCAPGPKVLSLPPGFAPEGIASGRGHRLFVSSIKDGTIYALDARSGTGAVLVPPSTPPRPALGLKFDRRSNQVLVAGGSAADVRIYESDGGHLVADVTLSEVRPSFVNDLIITAEAAYLTESTRPALYRLPRDRDGRFGPSAATEIPLGGDFRFLPGKLNANGIVAGGRPGHLVIVNTSSGALYEVDAANGMCTTIEVPGEPLVRGDGLLLRGRTLYVVQNLLNQIAVLTLLPGGTSALRLGTLTSAGLDVPTTAAALDGALYVVNARYTTPPTAITSYAVVRLDW
jgi:hypothetical protein